VKNRYFGNKAIFLKILAPILAHYFGCHFQVFEVLNFLKVVYDAIFYEEPVKTIKTAINAQ